MGQWAQNEMGGYTDWQGLPDYRGPLDTRVLGDFSGPYGSRQTSVPLPMNAFPENMQIPALFKVHVVQGVTEIEAVIATNKGDHGGTVQVPWQAEIVSRVNWLVQQGKMELLPMMGLETIYRTLSVWTLQGVLDTIRLRVLDFALELEGLAPGLLSDGVTETSVTPAQVHHIYYTTVMAGGSAAIGLNAVAIQNAATDVADRIVLAIDQAADAEEDEDKEGWLRKSAAYFGNAGKDVLVEIAATALNKQLGQA